MDGSTDVNSAGVTIEDSHQQSFPTASFLCVAIGVYVTLVLVALAVRKYVKTKEVCGCDKDFKCSLPSCPMMADCCTWLNGRCQTIAECSCAKQCFKLPDCKSCRNLIVCPTGPCSSCLDRPLFDCGRFDCTCSCQLPECQNINCCCFEIRIKK